MGQISIANYVVVLRERIIKVANSGRTRTFYNDIVLFDARKPVAKGYLENFSCEVRLPPNFRGYTAIGNIISRAYYLTVLADVCCCYSNPHL